MLKLFPFLFLLSICFMNVLQAKIVVDKSMVNKEKEILENLRRFVNSNLEIMEKIENKENVKNSFNFLVNNNKKCLKRIDNSTLINNEECVALLDLKIFDKKSQIYNFLQLPLSEGEAILNFSFLNLNKMNYNFNSQSNEKKQANSVTNQKTNIYKNFIIIIFTNKSVIAINNEGKILTTHPLNFKEKILRADMTYFEEDGSIAIYSENSEISYFIIDIKLGGNNYDELEVEIFIPLRRSITVNTIDNLTFLKQHKLHGHKYIVLSFENGNIIVMNKDLEMKSSLVLQRKIDNLFLSNGILTVISRNDLIFLNVLGGNSVLLKCTNYYDIMKIEYDTNNNFLFALDEDLNLIIFNNKLSISKQNSNECNPIFKVQLPKEFKTKSKKVHMEIVRNILFITLDTDYIAIIDINLLNENGLVVNEFLIYNEGNRTSSDNNLSLHSNHPVVNFLTYGGNLASNYILMKNEKQQLILVEVKNFKTAKSSITNQNDYPGLSGDSSQSIFKPLFSTLTSVGGSTAGSNTNFDNYFYVYLCLIVVLSIFIVFYKQKKLKEEKAKLAPKKFSEDDQKMLAEMMQSMGSLKDKTSKLTKNKNNSQFDEEKYDDQNNYTEDEDFDNEEMEEFEEEEEGDLEDKM